MGGLSARGLGAGQNGGKDFKKPVQGTFIGDIQLGTCQIVDVPNADLLKTWTQQVLNNTFKEISIPNTNKICPPTNSPSGGRGLSIKHVVYITKENRTYDEVFGQLKQANGDPSLARFGLNVDIKHQDSLILRGVNITPNHHKIAQEWSFSDNFYCDSDASIHGHHWMMGTIPNEYVEANSAAEAEFKPFSKAKGRRFPKTTAGVDPEDYNEIGGIWDNLSHKHANFGLILKTIYHILGIPYVNQYDATAALLDDYFTETPDFKGYEALENDPSVFQPEKAMKVYGRDFDWRVIKQGAKFDNENEQRADHYRQQNGGH